MTLAANPTYWNVVMPKVYCPYRKKDNRFTTGYSTKCFWDPHKDCLAQNCPIALKRKCI